MHLLTKSLRITIYALSVLLLPVTIIAASLTLGLSLRLHSKRDK